MAQYAGSAMKTQLHASLGQHLTMTPQLQQALRLLQMSAAELEVELAQAVASNPLLEWADEAASTAPPSEAGSSTAAAEGSAAPEHEAMDSPDWTPDQGQWANASGGRQEEDDSEDPAYRLTSAGDLGDHLRWQLHLLHLSERDRSIGATLIDAIDNDGYLREPLLAIAEALLPEITASPEEILAVLRHVQQFDPPGVGARDLGECLSLQLALLPAQTPGRELALMVAAGPLQRLPRAGVEGLARELRQCPLAMQTAVTLLRSLNPRPGTGHGQNSHDTYVVPDVVVWRARGKWQAALAGHAGPRVVIHSGYEQLLQHCQGSDAGYLRSHLQQARWLLRGLQARGQTLLRVARSLLLHQAGYLEFGEQAMRPLTLREIASELDLHESTISRAIAGKYIRTPRGTIALRQLFSSGVDTDQGGGASSTAIQALIRRMVDAENPRKPLSDAKLTELIKQGGVAVARRTVAKYREAMNIPPSHERVRIG